LALPKSVESGKLSVNKVGIRGGSGLVEVMDYFHSDNDPEMSVL
jgi:hypothetical protein